MEKEPEERLLTPVDIEHQNFETQSFGGYNIEEVDRFLRRIVTDFEKLLLFNAQLKERVDFLSDRISGYEKIEENIKAALFAAQNIAEELREIKVRECELMLEEARQKSQEVLLEADKKRDQTEREIASLKDIKRRLKTELELMLKGYLSMVNNINID